VSKKKSPIPPAAPLVECEAHRRGLTAIIPSDLPEWFHGHKGPAFITTLDETDDDQFALALEASVGRDVLLQSEVNMEFDLAHWFVSPWEGVDEESSEPKCGVRIALIDTDGRIHVTYSEGVRKTLTLIIDRVTRGLLKLPTRVMVKSKQVPLPGSPPRIGNMLYLALVRST
jgi:hypothetical protein